MLLSSRADRLPAGVSADSFCVSALCAQILADTVVSKCQISGLINKSVSSKHYDQHELLIVFKQENKWLSVQGVSTQVVLLLLWTCCSDNTFTLLSGDDCISWTGEDEEEAQEH